MLLLIFLNNGVDVEVDMVTVSQITKPAREAALDSDASHYAKFPPIPLLWLDAGVSRPIVEYYCSSGRIWTHFPNRRPTIDPEIVLCGRFEDLTN